MYFRTFQPTANLSTYIRFYWILEHGQVPSQPEVILPDGCMELIIHYGDRYISDFGNKEETQPENIIVGQITQAIKLQPTGKTGIIAVRFHPWGLHGLTGIPMNELKHRFLDSSDILGKNTLFLREELNNKPHQEKIAVIERHLYDILLKNRDAKSHNKLQYFEHITGIIQKTAGNSPVAKLAGLHNLSVRQFNRSFNEVMGVSPKQFNRIIRLQHFLSSYQPGGDTLTNVLHESGYYDQAHFIREFRDMAGMTPTAFFKESKEMSDLMLMQ